MACTTGTKRNFRASAVVVVVLTYKLTMTRHTIAFGALEPEIWHATAVIIVVVNLEHCGWAALMH